jgi:hypothetical protein
MATELTYPHVEKPQGEPARLQRMPRLRIAQIAMEYLAHGWSADEMCRQHPNLRPSEAYAAMGYYFDHQAEIDQEIRDEWEHVRQERLSAPRSPFFVRMHAKGLL